MAVVGLNETKCSVSLILMERTVKEMMGKKSQSRRVFNIKNIKKKKKRIFKTCRRLRSSLISHVFFLIPTKTRPIYD